ncbi:MAG TPA: glucose-6-phosphate dehydrogenase [Candidatus Baltobacteraceae bacterium]|jgi:glucose-6-phosphate 1-dehydrogenase|nr:glucose-6-phosphate dehydrogenase [Candidatus Baltobacteraceae bacterium]
MTATSTTAGNGMVQVSVNPLRAGIESIRISEPCTIVFFGASGDLFKRMLMPAIYNLRLDDILPANFGLIGFARTSYTDEEFRKYCRDCVDEFSRSGPVKESLWNDLAERIGYITADFNDTSHFTDLKKKLEDYEKKFGAGHNRLYYLATPPSVFPKIIGQLKSAGLDPGSNTAGWSRIIVEKPFGSDLESARALQAEVEKVFNEQQVYRIDHYLGKETVQDIMALRFANTIFEPIWTRNYIQSVQITAAETLGVEQRGGYYDSAGALRDMIQNHVLNLLALVAMEPPAGADADAIRNEKYKVFSAIAPPNPEDVFHMSVRGQYDAGMVGGEMVPAYRNEPDVRPDSNTETYAGLRLYINNWRWAGVPFFLRSGKRLARKVSEIAITFNTIPHRLFGEKSDTIEQNVLVIKIQPDEGISMRFNAKVPGQKNHIRSVTMDFNYGTGFGVRSAPAYERLIADAMRGDATLFTRWDAVQRAWEIVMPILEVWQSIKDRSFPNYPAGSDGPEAAKTLNPAWRPL